MLSDAPADPEPARPTPAAEPPPSPVPSAETNRLADLFADAEETAPAARREPTPQADDPSIDEAEAPETTAAPAEPAPAAATSPEARPKVRLKVKKRGLHIRLPRLPPVVARLAPFVGPLVFVSAILVAVAFVTFRTAVVAAAPTLAGFYASIGLEVNLRGLTFGPIQTLREMENGQPVLVVEGSLSNATAETRDVPAIRFALRDGEAQELYAWSVDPRATTIAAGDQLRFRTRLVAPPERAADLQVRFVERRNHQAGLP